MKKFSKETNQKINDEPKIKQVPLNEEDLFKASVQNLMDQILTVQTYGPVDRYLRAGNIKIAGKEMFIEALMDLMGDKSTKDKIKLLESLKSRISDWESLDGIIDETNSKLFESRSSKMTNHRKKITDLYKLYKDDRETLMKRVDDMIGRIKNGEKAYWRGITAEQMASESNFPRTIMKEIANKFFFKAKQLGYSK